MIFYSVCLSLSLSLLGYVMSIQVPTTTITTTTITTAAITGNINSMVTIAIAAAAAMVVAMEIIPTLKIAVVLTVETAVQDQDHLLSVSTFQAKSFFLQYMAFRYYQLI